MNPLIGGNRRSTFTFEDVVVGFDPVVPLECRRLELTLAIEGINKQANPSTAISNSINDGGCTKTWFRGVSIETRAFTLN